MYITSTLSNYCLVKINNKITYDGHINGIDNLHAPYTSLVINSIKYDTLAYKESGAFYFYFKPYKKGMLKFKSDNDIFELIP